MSSRSSEKRTELAAFSPVALSRHFCPLLSEPYHLSTKSSGGNPCITESTAGLSVVVQDLKVEGIDFDRTYTPLQYLGYKTVVSAIAKIYGMNALPAQIMLKIAVSNLFSVESLTDFYDGFTKACADYVIDFVSNEICSSDKGFIIAATVIGESNERYLREKNTAQVHDLIAVAGDLGAAYLGFWLLEREKKIFLENPDIQPDFSAQHYIIQKYLRPNLPTGAIDFLAEHKIQPGAMHTIDQGLSAALLSMSEASQTGCLIFEEKLPIDERAQNFARQMDIDPTMCALNGGEDYALLFTLSHDDYQHLSARAEKLPFTIIGYVSSEDQGHYIQSSGGAKQPLTAPGYQAQQLS